MASPLIASKYFFSGDAKSSNTNVQYVYLAVALMGVCVALAFFFTKLPEIDEQALQAQLDQAAAQSGDGQPESNRTLWLRIAFGAATQFCYVGAQVTIGTFFLNYAHENGGMSDAQGSQFLSYGLIAFFVGRFVGTGLLSVVSAPLLLAIYSLVCAGLICAISSLQGMGGVVCLIVIMFFESIVSLSAASLRFE